MSSPSQGSAPNRSHDPIQEGIAISKLALDLGASESKMISPDSIVVGEWVRLKCQYGCPKVHVASFVKASISSEWLTPAGKFY